ncbi:adenosine receptor A2b-like protein, partial [Dinothrombium tinctorium]
IIISCWIIGSLIGFLPLFGWNNGPEKWGRCLFIPVMSYNLLVFVFFGTIVFPAILMAFCYLRIYLIVVRQVGEVLLFSSLSPSPSSLSAFVILIFSFLICALFFNLYFQTMRQCNSMCK